jgi:hypothetical protein
MNRRQFMEIEDQSWCPAALRDGTTDFLQTVMTLTDPYAPIRPLLLESLNRCGTRRIIDLCSGGGGPWQRFYPSLQKDLAQPLQLWLTDLYPNPRAGLELQKRYPQQIGWWPGPVDALGPPEQLSGFYTLFTSAHHFRPEALGHILRQAVKKGQGIALFELTNRSLPALMLALLIPLIVLLLTPLCRPFYLSRFFWVYLIPLVPLLALFDGIVSCLRSYRADELRSIVAQLGDNGYNWQIGEKPSNFGLTPLTYLIGIPQGSQPTERSNP